MVIELREHASRGTVERAKLNAEHPAIVASGRKLIGEPGLAAGIASDGVGGRLAFDVRSPRRVKRGGRLDLELSVAVAMHEPEVTLAEPYSLRVVMVMHPRETDPGIRDRVLHALTVLLGPDASTASQPK